MRVVLATESYRSSSKNPAFSGVAIFVERLARYLAEAGHEVMVITPSPEFFDGPSTITYVSLRSSASEQIGKSCGGPMEERPLKNLTVVNLPSWPNPFRSSSRIVAPLGLTAIKYFLQKFRPDIIHLQDPAEIGITVLRAAKKLRTPVILTSHSYLEFSSSYLQFLGPLSGFAEKMLLDHIVRTYNECDAITTPTSVLGKTLKKLGVLPKIYTVSNGVELDKFSPGFPNSSIMDKYSIPKGKDVVLYVGRLDKDKSLEIVLKAIPSILPVSQNAHFVFVGDGSSGEEYKELARKLKVDERVSWTGYISHDSNDLPEIYRLAKVFVMPSIEGQGIAALEAMASGVPVVAANAGGLRELIKNGRNGILFKFGNPKSLSRAVVSVLNNEEKAEQYGRNGRLRASEHDLHNSLKNMVKVYEAVIR